MRTNVILTSTAEHFKKLFLEKSKFNFIPREANKDNKNYFPDGELYVRMSKAAKASGRTVIIHAGAPNPNAGLIELEMILANLTINKIFPIEIFFSYFPYGRQDEISQKGEINVAETIIKKLITYYNVSKIYIVDAHFAGREWIKQYPITNLNPLSAFKKYIKEKYPDIVFLSPDDGSFRRTGIKGASKKRINSNEVRVTLEDELHFLIKGANVAVVDDLIETGGTLCQFFDECQKHQAKKIIAYATHGVLPAGIKRVKDKFAELYLTNSIKRKEANIDISDLVLSIF